MVERVQLGLAAAGGSHSAGFDDHGRLVVEWYDFGEAAPYESANMIVFDAVAQRRLAAALGAPAPLSPPALLALIAGRFGSWFEVKAFADAHAIRFSSAVDFLP